jgi:hypothetical protein
MKLLSFNPYGVLTAPGGACTVQAYRRQHFDPVHLITPGYQLVVWRRPACLEAAPFLIISTFWFFVLHHSRAALLAA